MKILLITHSTQVRRTWGVTKVALDASEALQRAGAHCEIFPQEDIKAHTYFDRLASYLEETRGEFDVIEIPDTLPYAIEPRKYAPLVVARSVLLPLHLKTIQYPSRPTTLKSRIKGMFLKPLLEHQAKVRRDHQFELVQTRLSEAHIINVANSMDRDALIREGFDADSILVLPYGLQTRRFMELASINISATVTEDPQLVFLGTFDFRKGCLDMVQVFTRFHHQYPSAKLRLLGTRGLMTSAQQVLGYFPRRIRKQIEIVESFEEKELPGLLEGCHLGLFPSYWEGFGIGVVEMLAAGIPVMAYNAPGPCDILPSEWLVPSGDIGGMVERLSRLWMERGDSLSQRSRSRMLANCFKWDTIGRQTLEFYSKELNMKQKESGSPH